MIAARRRSSTGIPENFEKKSSDEPFKRGHTDDLDEFRRILHRCWSLGTSSQWLPDNPARGQCNVTALVVWDRLGGEILKTPVGNDWHFYNRVAGTVYDLTAEQFAVPPAYLDIPSSRDEALAGTAPDRYQALAAHLGQTLMSTE